MSDDDAMPAPDAESRSLERRSPLERFLGLFADVAGGEGVNVAREHRKMVPDDRGVRV